MKIEELTFDKLPVEIQERMLLEQEEQGNERNPDVFRRYLYSGIGHKGFDWDVTEDGHDFWVSVLDGDFDCFFKRYPKKEEKLLELEEEEKPSLNLIKLLANAPTGLPLYSTVLGHCVLDSVNEKNEKYVVVRRKGNQKCCFSPEGKLMTTAVKIEDAECTLFPSKDQRDWSKFVVNPLKFKWSDYKPVCYFNCEGEKQVFPAHEMVQSWLFTEHTEDEAALAHHMAIIAEKSGMTANDLQHIFPAVLRMLKNDSAWSK